MNETKGVTFKELVLRWLDNCIANTDRKEEIDIINSIIEMLKENK